MVSHLFTWLGSSKPESVGATSTIMAGTSHLHTPTRLALVSVAAGLVLLLLCRQFLHPLAKAPGPILARFTGMWRNWYYLRGQWHDVVLALHAQYGRVVRIAPNEVSIVDKAAARALYGHGTQVVKTDWYETWDVPGTALGLFATRDRTEHSFFHRRVSCAFSMTAILEFEAYIQGCFDLLLRQLAARADSGKTVDMAEWTDAVAYGSQLGHVRTGSDVMGIRQAILTGFFWMANLGHYPGKSRFLHFRQWSVNCVRARMQESAAPTPGKSTRKDMLHHFVQMKDANGNPASEGEVLIEAMNIMYELNQTDPAEIDEYFAARPGQQGIPYSEARQLPYLQAVVSEATRLHPSIVTRSLLARRLASARGPRTAIAPFGGEDADRFRPERWLEDPVRARYFESVTMTFGGNGPRMCIGRNIGLVEMLKFIALMLHTFEVELVDTTRPWWIESFWFAYQHEMYVRL
ncbi:cytochrome P450 [Aspergillus eucalypticola CBS 122712]|uniref:Cytochrome P450 n=1 Tax=Aspergillus eucalypticola (strain CBS 122712 / IBT 29274) TaxID=1448314 RepID=A0A317UR00_ASPEC|nr:cytochrome P450 [Aspergillus eucalypticola CBS 122712]PWY64453.1 cytochrome P450 [Aspergillus eucalypticola CBS 122712]